MILLLIQIFLLLFFILGLVIIALNLYGFFVPNKNLSSLTHSYFHSCEKIWSTLNDVLGYPDWKKGVRNVHIQDTDGNLSWTEDTRHHFKVHYALTEAREPARLTVATTDSQMPLKCIRSYTIWRQDYMSFLKIEDELIIKKWHLRPLSKIFFNHRQSLREQLKSLDQHLDKRYGKTN